MVASVRPAKTTSVSTRAVLRPVARDVPTMRANGPCGGRAGGLVCLVLRVVDRDGGVDVHGGLALATG